jgi:hypothetical protein
MSANRVLGRTRGTQRLQEALLTSSIALAIVAWPAASISLAQPPQNCDAGWFISYVTATQNTQIGNHQGVKSDMAVSAANNDCVRVSSELIISGSSGLVEWGWVLGYEYSRSLGGACDTTTYHSSPTQFLVYRPINGSLHCALYSTIPTGTRTFSLKDDNSDTVWTFGSGGSTIGNVDLNFDRGSLRTNGERHSGLDSAYADFTNLQFQVSGSTTWFSFSFIQQVEDNDPAQQGYGDYNCVKVSSTHQQVTKQPRTCPTPAP